MTIRCSYRILTIAAAAISIGDAAATTTSSSARNKNNAGGRPLHVSLEAEESYLAPPGRSRRNRNDGRIKGRGQKENNSNNNNKEQQQQQHRAALHTDNIFGEEREEERSSSSLPAAFLPNITATGTISSPLSNLKQPRIIGGQSTVRDRYPYTASLIDTSSTNRHVCGGSLIAPDIVLTAGHCSGAFDSVQIGRHNIIDGELEAALAGGDIVDMNDPNAEVEDGYEYHVVERHVVHPLHSNIIRSDFALAKLYGSVSTVQPVKLNTDPSIPSNDEMVTVMGYGIIQKEGTIFNDMSTVLLEADVQYMPNAECAMISAPFNGQTVAYNGYVDDNMLCAWQLGTDACQGDSGGPLVYSINNNPKDDVQIGIVSWGLGCALEAFPGVYSRISEEMDWLTEQVCDLSDDPPEYFNCTGGQQQQQSGLVGGATTQDVTVVVELDENPQEVAWMMELDLSNGGGNGGKVSEDTYKPFGSFTLPSTTAVEVLSLVVDKQYKFTVLDRGSDNKNTKFRLCYGNVSIRECMGAKTTDEDSIIVCEGISRYNLITSASCPVVLQTARPTPRPTVSPTLRPTDNPVIPVWNDLMFGTAEPFFKPPTLRPTPIPTVSPTSVPSMTPTDVPTPRPSNEPSVYFTKAPAKDAPTDFFSKFDTAETEEEEEKIPEAKEVMEFEPEDIPSAATNILRVPSLLIIALSTMYYCSSW